MTIKATVEIVRAGAADTGLVAGLIGEAFHTLAVAEWLVPDPHQRAQILPSNFQIYVEHALVHGEIHLTADRTGVAVWVPRDRPVPEPDDYDARLVAACGRWVDRFRTLDTLFAANHPSSPHHHLAFLAVRPDRQRSGIGSALLRHHHAYLDQHAMPAYLEASSPQSRDLYARHGYDPHGKPFTVPSGAAFWPMWRPPGPAAADGS